MKKEGSFRITYFTKKYEDTCRFYEAKLGFEAAHSWSRSENDKGTLYKAGVGLIEVLLQPEADTHKHGGLDYRRPQGVCPYTKANKYPDSGA